MIDLRSPALKARQAESRARQATSEELAGLQAGRLYLCALCGGIYAYAWSDEEAEAEYLRNFSSRPSDERDEIICDPCYQEVAAHRGLERSQ